MSNSVPPGQRPPQLRDDEPIALLVAFLAFGAIFWWGLSQGRSDWNVSGLIPGLTGSPSPTPAAQTTPLLNGSPTVERSPRIAGDATTDESNAGIELVPSPQPTVGGGVVIPGEPDPSSPNRPVEQTRVTPAPTVSPIPKVGQKVGQKPVPNVSGAIAFSDVPKSYWAYPFIGALAARGIVSGFPDGTFKPNQPVTRAEFAVQLQKAFAKPDQLPPKQFTDIPPRDKWAIAVDRAVKGNFMSGYPEGDFRPEQTVSRAEAVVSMARGLELPQPADAEAILQGFQDQQQVADWARSRIAAAIQSKIFSGDPDTGLLNPNQSATRADVAALVYQGIEQNK